MTFVKVRPVAKRFPTMGDDFDRLFNDLFNSGNVEGNTKQRLTTRPTVNIIEKEGSYLLELAAPGLEKEDFGINVEKDLLTISVDKDLKKEENIKFKRREFGTYNFKRSFRLPETIDSDAIEATYQSGILKLVLPVREKEAPKRIKIA